MNNEIKKTSMLLVILLTISFVSCKDAISEEQETSTLNTEKLDEEGKGSMEENSAKENDVEEKKAKEKVIEEKVVEEKSRREIEFELLEEFKRLQYKTITDEFGLVQNYSINKEYGEDLIFKYTDEIRQTRPNGKWDGYRLIISLQEITNNLMINGELKVAVKTFQQVYVVEHQYFWGTRPDFATGANLTFEPEIEPLDKRKEIFTEISRRFSFSDDEPKSKWIQAYSNLIKNSGILDINTYQDFLAFKNQKAADSDNNKVAQVEQQDLILEE